MKAKRVISVVVAVCSAWLGGSLGTAALSQANAAPLATSAPGRASHLHPAP
jgi:hypothetical protein